MSENISPYLELPKRSQEEVRQSMREHQDHVIGAVIAMFKPTPAQEWLGSDRVTNALAKFRDEDKENS